MVVYKVLQPKNEIDLAFFLTLVLFSLVKIGKEIFTTEFLQPKQEKLYSSKPSTILKVILKIWVLYQRVVLCCSFLNVK